MANPTRSYDNGEIIVDWYPERCIHCKVCVNGLPEVFNLDARPWVNVKGASTDEIVEQVHKCPSAALSIRDRDIQ